MWPPFAMGVAYIKIQPDNKQATLKHIAKVFRTLFPNSPYSYTFKDLENQKNYESEAKVETDYVVRCPVNHFSFLRWTIRFFGYCQLKRVQKKSESEKFWELLLAE